MDEDIRRWILEFLLRQPSIPENILDYFLCSLPSSNTKPCFLKTLFLHRIESERSNGLVSEKTLDHLEQIEELNRQDGKDPTTSELMKASYCAVAVDCTVRCLEEDEENNGAKYLEKVKLIWKNRIPELEKSKNGLVSQELLSWKHKVVSAMWDSDICSEILTRNTTKEALKAVKAYVREAWKDLGPSFLELAAEMVHKMGVDGEELSGSDPGPSGVVEKVVGGVANACLALVVYDRNKVNAHSKGGDVEAPAASVRAGDVEAPASSVRAGQESLNMDKVAAGDKIETPKKQTPPRHKHITSLQSKRARDGRTGTSRGAKIADTNGEEGGTHSSPYSCVPAPDVDKLQDTYTSTVEKPTLIVDDAVPVSRAGINQAASETVEKPSQILYDDVPMSTASINEAAPETEEKPSQIVYDAVPVSRAGINEAASEAVEKPSQIVYDAVPVSNAGINEVAVENIDKVSLSNNPHVGDSAEDTHGEHVSPEGKGDGGNQTSQSYRAQNNRPKRSLLNRNGTAHVYEWNDSIDDLPAGPPSPKKRKKKRWTEEEEDALRAGVREKGAGNWKLILDAYRSRFQGRTEVDLKDKWRNLLKYSRQ